MLKANWVHCYTCFVKGTFRKSAIDYGYLVKTGKIESFDGMHPTRG